MVTPGVRAVRRRPYDFDQRQPARAVGRWRIRAGRPAVHRARQPRHHCQRAAWRGATSDVMACMRTAVQRRCVPLDQRRSRRNDERPRALGPEGSAAPLPGYVGDAVVLDRDLNIKHVVLTRPRAEGKASVMGQRRRENQIARFSGVFAFDRFARGGFGAFGAEATGAPHRRVWRKILRAGVRPSRFDVCGVPAHAPNR